MKKIDFSKTQAQDILNFQSQGAGSVPFGQGDGKQHIYCLYIAPQGEIGWHEAGFDQLLLVVQGEGWAAEQKGEKIHLKSGQGVFFKKGTCHSKGSDLGMVAMMVQSDCFELNSTLAIE